MFKRTLVSIAVASSLLMTQQVYAEEEINTDDIEVIQVTGIRGSLNKSISMKKESMQVVDAIVAEDIGKFPDNNVVEALQRVTGVQTTDRNAGEVNTVTIRGLTDVTTTINGREMFTAAGRTLAVADIPAALLQSVSVYKTRSASQLESGIAGQLDVLTQRPFYFDGAKFMINARGVYQDQADKTDPIVSALMSNRWDTAQGEFGALLNLSYARTNYRDQSVTAGAAVPFRADNLERMFPEGYGWEQGLESGLSTTPGSTITHLATGEEVEYLLSRDAMFQNDYTGERERPAVNLSLQWAPNNTSEYVFEAFYNGYRNESQNDLLFSFADWWGNLPSTPPVVYEGTNIIKSRGVGSPYGFTSGDVTKETTDSYMFALGGKWDVGEDTVIKSEIVYQTSEFETEFMAMRTDTTLPYVEFDFNADDGVPAWDVLDGEGGQSVDLTDVSMWRTAQVYDNGGKNEGDALTYTLDADIYLDNGFFTSAKVGMRYDLRTAKEYARDVEGEYRSDLSSLDPSMVKTITDFYDGGASVPTSWVGINGKALMKNRDLYRELSNFNDLVLEQTFDIEQTTWSLYAQTDFETELFGNVLDGQFGVRYVNAEADMTFFNIDGEEGEEASTDSSNSSSKLLPSLVLRYYLTDDLIARFAYTETLRRPEFTQLNSFLRLREDVTNKGNGDGTGGNADLKPVESKNYDVSLEYYFGEGSSIYGTYFYRDIEGFVYDSLRRVTVDNKDYIVTMPDNSSNGVLKGFELGGVYFLENVPEWADGFGIQASATFLDSSQDLPEYAEDGTLTGYTNREMFGVSDTSYSGVFIYEKEDFSARLSYVWRDAFLAYYEAPSFANPRGVYRRPEQSLDFQFSYDITDDLVVSFDATNLTNETFQQYYEDQDRFNLSNSIYSRTFGLGMRYTF